MSINNKNDMIEESLLDTNSYINKNPYVKPDYLQDNQEFRHERLKLGTLPDQKSSVFPRFHYKSNSLSASLKTERPIRNENFLQSTHSFNFRSSIQNPLSSNGFWRNPKKSHHNKMETTRSVFLSKTARTGFTQKSKYDIKINTERNSYKKFPIDLMEKKEFKMDIKDVVNLDENLELKMKNTESEKYQVNELRQKQIFKKQNTGPNLNIDLIHRIYAESADDYNNGVNEEETKNVLASKNLKFNMTGTCLKGSKEKSKNFLSLYIKKNRSTQQSNASDE